MHRKAFVHIGTHKTGTTFLQTWMRVNRVKLAEIGLIFPMVGIRNYNSAHGKLSYAVRSTKGPLEENDLWYELRAILSKSDGDVVISAETFSDKIRNNEQTQKIIEFFEALGMETVFVVFLRDVPAYFNSIYVQDTKNLRTPESFKSYVDRRCKDRAFDYPLTLKPFEDVAKVTVLPYTRSIEPIQDRFLNALGRSPKVLEQISWKDVPPKNTSLGLDAIYVARRIASLLPSDIPTEELHMKRKYFKHLSYKFGLNDETFVGCDAAFANDLRARFSDSTNQIAERYFEKRWRDTIPPEPMFDAYRPEEHSEHLTEQKIEAIVKKVLAARPTFRTKMIHKFKSSVKRRLL